MKTSSRNSKNGGHQTEVFVEYEQTPIIQFWILAWFLISGLVCTVDVVYTMNRPHTNDPNNPMSRFFFAGWRLYSSNDRHYATTNDIITCSTGRVMLLEIFLNFLAIGLAISRSRHAVPIAFTTNLMVLWKTVLFFSFFLNQPEGHEPAMNVNKGVFQQFMLFWVPNGVWIVVPIFVLMSLWNKIALPPRIIEKYWDHYSECRGEILFKKND